MDLRPHPASASPVDYFRRPDPALLPHLSVDCAVFGFHAGELKLLLVEWRHLGRWSLPGGHVRRDEAVDAAAARVLAERTGLERIYLRQFHTFGATDRGEGVLASLAAALGTPLPAGHWMAERVVSVAYLALVSFAEVTPTPDAFSAACGWWDVRERPPLVMDHDAIVAGALAALRADADSRPLGLDLLPEKFTMPELQRLHEAVLGRPLDRRNFQKRTLELGFVERLPERKTGGAHRAPFLYRFGARARHAEARPLGAAGGDPGERPHARR
jgi:ADP-ribose pyrophosphatase YjhB (NUDIX family)